HGRADAEALEDRQGVLDAPERVVERHVQPVPAGAERLGCADGAEPSREQAPELGLERCGADGERVRPVIGDCVVAENERPEPAHARRACSIRSSKTSSTSPANDRGSTPATSAWSRRYMR